MEIVLAHLEVSEFDGSRSDHMALLPGKSGKVLLSLLLHLESAVDFSNEL